MKKINCLIGVILIEMLYIINELIWQKVCVLAKNKVFSIRFFLKGNIESMCLLQHNFWMICKILWTIMYVRMILEQHLTNFLLHVLNLKKSSWILHAFEKLQKKAHLRDVIEAWGMSYVVKFINFCSLHIQFYVWLKYLYNRMFFSNL